MKSWETPGIRMNKRIDIIEHARAVRVACSDVARRTSDVSCFYVAGGITNSTPYTMCCELYE